MMELNPEKLRAADFRATAKRYRELAEQAIARGAAQAHIRTAEMLEHRANELDPQS